MALTQELVALPDEPVYVPHSHLMQTPVRLAGRRRILLKTSVARRSISRQSRWTWFDEHRARRAGGDESGGTDLPLSD